LTVGVGLPYPDSQHLCSLDRRCPRAG